MPHLYACDFHADPLPHGWTWIPADGGAMAFIASEGSYPAKGGRLIGPAIGASPDPGAFYRLRFRTRTAQLGYWAVFTQDAAGVDQVDDCYASVQPSAEWLDHEVVVRNRAGASSLRFMLQGHAPIAVADLEVAVIDIVEAGRWADRLHQSLPPLDWTPPARRWAALPRTLERLHAGGELRVVQLGDSIVNDTNNGNWDALVHRSWPQTRLRLHTAVRGGTGCWHYRQPEQFASYVTAHRPDLLLIGGISHQRKDVPAADALADLRAVILRARDGLGCEVAVMSGPMAHDWRAYDPAALQAPLPVQEPPPVNEFYLGQEALAMELGIAFLDCHRAWHRYLGASRAPWQWFHRDSVHANDRGKQVLAQILARWFAPAPGADRSV